MDLRFKLSRARPFWSLASFPPSAPNPKNGAPKNQLPKHPHGAICLATPFLIYGCKIRAFARDAIWDISCPGTPMVQTALPYPFQYMDLRFKRSPVKLPPCCRRQGFKKLQKPIQELPKRTPDGTSESEKPVLLPNT